MPRRVIYNDDSQGLAEARPGSVEKDLRAWVDKPLTQIPIDTYAWCVAFPDIVHYNSQVGEVYGQRFKNPPNQMALAIAELAAQGTDVLEIVAEQAHRHGVEFVASVRMGDTHHSQADPNNPQVPSFLLDHPEYVIKRSDGIPETALDYSFPKVRKHRLAILRELVENYDIDGIELDFVRWGKFFVREQAPFKAPIMTRFVGQVRRAIDTAAADRGRRRPVLGVQVLRSLYLNHLAGLDPRAWVEKGWLDYIIQCDYNCTDPQIPVSEFAEFCRGSDCTHHVRMGSMMGGRWDGKPYLSGRKVVFTGNRGYGGMILTPEEARGAAANIYGFGADGVGLWNICCNMGRLHKPGAHPGLSREEFQHELIAWANAAFDRENLWSKRRVYHFVPIYKSSTVRPRNFPVNALRYGPAGEPVQIVPFWPNSKGRRQVYRFLMADGRHGEKLDGFLRFRILQSTVNDEFVFDINTLPIDCADVRADAVTDDELPYVWYEIDLAKCPPFAGTNELGMTMTRYVAPSSQANDSAQKYDAFPYMEELEIIVDPKEGSVAG